MKNFTARIAASLLISAVGFYFAAHNTQWKDLGFILLHARARPLLVALLAAPTTLWLRGVRWKIMLDPFAKIPILRLVRWQIGGVLINNIFPLRAGELVRAYWTGHKTNISKGTVLATIVAERLLDISSISILGLFVFLALDIAKPASRATAIFLGTMALFFPLLLLFKSNLQQPLRKEIRKRLTMIHAAKVHSALEQLAAGLKMLTDTKKMLMLTTLSAVIWSIEIAVIAVLSRSLNLNLSWSRAAVVMIGLLFGNMVPAAPGSAGTYEAGGVSALTLLGVDKTLGLSCILLLHGFNYMLTLLLGVPILVSEGLSPKRMFAEMEHRASPG